MNMVGKQSQGIFCNCIAGAKKAEEVRHTEVTIVKKSHLSLTCVPTDLAEGATEVYLGGNHIRSLTPRVFSRIPKCSYLDLSYNKITTIESESFEGLYGLHVLDLSGNPLPTIRKDMWVGLRSLRTLSIMYTQVVEIHSCGFSHLPKLEVLKIDVWKTTELNYVLLDKSTFPDTPKQPKLHIEHNSPSMVCDTGMCWLKAAEQSQLIANYTHNGTRVTPKCSNFHNTSWNEVREKIHCHDDTGNKIVVATASISNPAC